MRQTMRCIQTVYAIKGTMRALTPKESLQSDSVSVGEARNKLDNLAMKLANLVLKLANLAIKLANLVLKLANLAMKLANLALKVVKLAMMLAIIL